MGSPDPDYAPCVDSKECKPPKTPKIPTVFAPPPSSSHGRATFATALIIAGSALAFLIICLSLFLLVRRRRQERRRREALLEAALAAAAPTGTAAPDAGGGPDLEEAEQEEGEVVHHAWHIRTVGLDEVAIESIALTRYRAGGAGASDCAVCLGEFADGELLRLLPRCAHAFHVPCIHTWLRAHVNCPLCRAHVLGPAPTTGAAAAEQSDTPAGTDADSGQAVGITRTTEQGQRDQQQASELRVQIDQRDGQSNSPEQPRRPPGRYFRRVVSMDSPPPVASSAPPPEDEQAGGDKKQGTGGAVRCEVSSPGCSGRVKNHRGRGMERSLSVGSRWALISRHGRRSSSLLPL